MTKKDIQKFLKFLGGITGIMLLVSGFDAGWDIGGGTFLKEGIVTAPSLIRLSLLYIMCFYAYQEANHDFRKIEAGKSINHRTSAIARVSTFTGLITLFAMWNYFSVLEILTIMSMVLVSFSFIFNIRLNYLRDLPVEYINPKGKSWYDRQWARLGKEGGTIKLLFEAITFLLGIGYFFIQNI